MGLGDYPDPQTPAMPGVDSGTKNSDAGTNSAVDRARIRMGTLQKKKKVKRKGKKKGEATRREGKAET